MNFYLWSKPPAADVNAWEELGNPGWNWEAFQKYTLRAEKYVFDSPINMRFRADRLQASRKRRRTSWRSTSTRTMQSSAAPAGPSRPRCP